MNDIKRELLKRGCTYKEQCIDKALDDAYEQIVTIVKEFGGVLKTPAQDGKIALYAFYEDFDGLSYHRQIHGLRYDDELGLCICTDDMLDNYTFDTGYAFENYRNFEGKDAEEMDKLLDDMAYYVEFDKYDLVYAPTVRAIIGGIGDYL
jgi:hypothetical protein